MYKNLSPEGLGISGRQSELIELSLTFGFSGFDMDMVNFAKQVEKRGMDQARRLIDSAKISIGSFALPIHCDADDATFADELQRLPGVAAAAAALGAVRCYIVVEPASDSRPYHENFELHRTRLGQIADALAPHDVRLGIDFRPTADLRVDRKYKFIAEADALLTLIRTVGRANVGLKLDLWNWQVGGGTLEQLQEFGVAKIVSVCSADMPEDVALEELTDEQRLLPGETGVVDASDLLRWLVEGDYDGPYAPVASNTQFVDMTRDQIVQKASEAADAQWGTAGLNKHGKLSPAPSAVAGEGEDEEA